MKYLSLSACFITMAICSIVHAEGIQPVIVILGGMSSPLGQQSQTLTFDNTVFSYQPDHTSAMKPMWGIFTGAEYPFHSIWAWQTGLGFYQVTTNSVNGSETQAPISNPSAINMWDYHYKVLSRQIYFENKLSFKFKNHYRPWLSLGLGESFNYVYGFQVTPQNSGEVATAVYGDHLNRNSIIYMIGLGMDVDITQHMRLGAGYRLSYLGHYDLGKGTLDTGSGGGVFFLPRLKSNNTYSSQALIQMTYLF